MKWQSIETAPRDGTDVLLWAPKWNRIHLGHYDIIEHFRHGKRESHHEGWWLRSVSMSGFENDPTHWMPLPEVPVT